MAMPDTQSHFAATKLFQVELTKLPVISQTHAVEHPKPVKPSGFDTLVPRLTASNSSLFLYHSQVDPDYELLIEFFAEDWGKEHFLAPPGAVREIPWFALATQRKSRISGWKDANLLYKANTTYHS
ncbi:hypothetical protein [Pseudoalteromonas arabiensis]|uniref:hypothetical protein n=1 Tax=Pseudoalteromonas arabiensis TaxID=874454 RepID=UPI000781B044|nr:hypothetical protein [Pseudoalteromonas arabiensis]